MGHKTGDTLGLRDRPGSGEDRRGSIRTQTRAGVSRFGDTGDESVASERLRNTKIDEGILRRIETGPGTWRGAATSQAGNDASARNGPSVLLGRLYSIRKMDSARPCVTILRKALRLFSRGRSK